MIGAIIGDIVGSPYEFNNITKKTFPLFSKDSTFTDDTIMTIAVYDGIRHADGKIELLQDCLIDSMHDYGRRYPSSYGGRFAEWLRTRSRVPYMSFGNGSAMRVSPVAWLFNTLEDVEFYAERTASVTHNHPEGIKGAQAVASAIFKARTGSSKNEIRSFIEDRYGYDLSKKLDEIRQTYSFNETCQGSVPEAITAFLESTDFEDCLRSAVSIGGDSDTIAAIAGSIAEGFYDAIPHRIMKKAMTYLDAALLERVEDFRAYLASSTNLKKGVSYQ
ncbi:MAG: ADP-ribosylglycohydrolase family protein [Desulfovibrio sp.]|nr:ADP-ribosylglycohydrolase family protein [Desulfovibrio sp.]